MHVNKYISQKECLKGPSLISVDDHVCDVPELPLVI